MRLTTLVLISTLVIISGCATPAYKEVFKEKQSYNSREFSVTKDVLYQAMTRALCAKNFIIDKEDPDNGFILAKRSFQRGKRTIALIVQAKLDSIIPDKTTLYLSGLETKEVYYVADRTRFFLFIIPLPGGGGKEASHIKEGEKIIQDKEFYNNFFSTVESEMQRICALKQETQEKKEEIITEEKHNQAVTEEQQPPTEQQKTEKQEEAQKQQ